MSYLWKKLVIILKHSDKKIMGTNKITWPHNIKKQLS